MNSLVSLTLFEAMRRVGNDYSVIECEFFARTGQQLGQVCADKVDAALLDVRLSVVIPSYNGHRTLLSTLSRLFEQRYRDFEIVVVDDGSDPPIAELIDVAHLPVPTRIIRVPNSRGTAVARNIGAQYSDGDTLVFLDDDLLVPAGMTLTLGLRQTNTSHCLFLGFREDVDAEVFFNPGDRKPSLAGDWRARVRQDRPAGVVDVAADQAVERYVPTGSYTFLGSTGRFKQFGNGRVVGELDLPRMVIGHTMCAKKADVVAAGGFAEDLFEGWGVEDTAFGAAMIAGGNFVIPADDCVSFHLMHEGRRVSRKEELEQMKRNFLAYRKHIEEPVGLRAFPSHRVRRTGKKGVYEFFD